MFPAICIASSSICQICRKALCHGSLDFLAQKLYTLKANLSISGIHLHALSAVKRSILQFQSAISMNVRNRAFIYQYRAFSVQMFGTRTKQRVLLLAGCGPSCTHDGLHYSNATYDTAMQIWANHLLLSVSQQRSRKLMLG